MLDTVIGVYNRCHHISEEMKGDAAVTSILPP